MYTPQMRTLMVTASLVVASLPVVLLVVLGSQRLYFARFALPALPDFGPDGRKMAEDMLKIVRARLSSFQ